MAGRPKAYDTLIKPQLLKITELKRAAYTDKQIASLIGIGYTTLIENRNKYPELALALKTGKDDLVLTLENSLYKSANGGFKLTTLTKKYIVDEDGNRIGQMEITEVIKEVGPSTGALVFALKNLAGDKWQDKTVHNIDNEEMSNAVKEFLKGGKK